MLQIARRRFLGSGAALGAAMLTGFPSVVQAATQDTGKSMTVTIRDGVLAGTREANGTRVWRGIPFASPPVGPLRGHAPQPPAAWDGVRDATQFGNQAVQQALGEGMGVSDPGSEDCLYLNVWAPEAPSETPRPVLVWIHGGGYVLGSGSDPLSIGDDYAARGDLVYVSLNYRLSGIGFLKTALDPASANLALLDQIAALKWIRDNIAAFGGDPANVTVMGESAGGMAISTLISSPLAHGLFARAIVQSGGARPIYTQDEADAVNKLALSRAGLAPGSDAEFMALPLEELKQVFQTMSANSNTPLLGGEPFHPAVDGVVLPEHPLMNLAPVPVMIGHCENEGQTFAQLTNLIEGLPLKTRARIGDERWAALEQAYHDTPRPDRDPDMDLFSDCFTGVPSLRLANVLTALGAPVWSYRFDYQKASPIGAAHASDLAFTFGKPESAPFPVDWTDEAQLLSDRMRDSFIAFARSGSPQTDAMPEWPHHDPKTLAYLRFDSKLTVANDFVGEERRSAWKDVPADAV